MIRLYKYDEKAGIYHAEAKGPESFLRLFKESEGFVLESFQHQVQWVAQTVSELLPLARGDIGGNMNLRVGPDRVEIFLWMWKSGSGHPTFSVVWEFERQVSFTISAEDDWPMLEDPNRVLELLRHLEWETVSPGDLGDPPLDPRLQVWARDMMAGGFDVYIDDEDSLYSRHVSGDFEWNFVWWEVERWMTVWNHALNDRARLHVHRFFEVWQEDLRRLLEEG